MSTDLINRAQTGDEQAFRQLVDPYRHELHVHCYRMLGSVQDAEDMLQETLLAAWQGLGGFEGRASIRTWLYRIATSRCLNALRSANRRPRTNLASSGAGPEPTRLGEVLWLEPYPDVVLAGLADDVPGPEARYEARETISLAFVKALQLLPPRQCAVLVLRDVVGFPAREVARILECTEESVTSALKRARAALQRSGRREPAPPPNSVEERELATRLARAWESGDVDGVVGLLTDDVWLTMPPMPMEYQGRELAARFLAQVAFRDGRTYRSVATRANGQPAFATYLRAPQGGLARMNGLLVLTLAGDQISAITRFEPSVLPRFELPATLPN